MICKLKQHNLLITFLLHILVSVEMLQICLRTGNFHLHYDSMRNRSTLRGDWLDCQYSKNNFFKDNYVLSSKGWHSNRYQIKSLFLAPCTFLGY